jgi:hypothetical protein
VASGREFGASAKFNELLDRVLGGEEIIIMKETDSFSLDEEGGG